MALSSLKRTIAGVMVVDKPEGVTSFGVIRRIRAITRIKKIGHTGTLDPMATGVLPLCLGQATKLAPYLQAGEKEYEGEMQLGLTTDTGDITGRVERECPVDGISSEDVARVASMFVGEIEQTPPAYSALKFNGRPGYELARNGLDVPVRPRRIIIHELTLTSNEPPNATFRVRVSKGTYIRSLVSDIGDRLGTGACLTSLRRLASAPFSIRDAATIEEIETLAAEDRFNEKILGMEQALSFLPQISVSNSLVRLVENGQPLPVSSLEDFQPTSGPVRIQSAHRGLMALYEYKPVFKPEGGYLTALRVLN